jgi:hypothetical protein
VTAAEVLAALGEVEAAIGGLGIDDLEAVACRATELRQRAWAIRANKLGQALRAPAEPHDPPRR